MQDLNFKKWIKAATDKVPCAEPWKGYYLVRGMEIDFLLRFVGAGRLGISLDMGCGNGFTSCLISSRAEKVIASDLYCKDAVTHSVGLESAQSLLSGLKMDNITLLASSIQNLPFKDKAFDTVYAGYVLQYLKDHSAALKELRRIAKDDGIVILVLPNFLERIYAFFQFYTYLGIKALKGVRTIDKKEAFAKLDKFKDNYKYFPFPGPHGAYRNSAVEMSRHMPFSWDREFRKNGFKIARSFTTMFVPYPLVLTVSLKAASVLSNIFEAFTRYFGDKPVMKYLGYNYCVVLKK